MLYKWRVFVMLVPVTEPETNMARETRVLII